MKGIFSYKSVVIISLILFGFTRQDSKVSAWEKIKVKNSISLYIRENPLSDVKEIKAKTNIKAPLSALVYLIKKAELQKQWAYATLESKVVRKYTEFHWVTYTLTDAPWPVCDRDCVTDVKMSQLNDSSVFIATIEVDSIMDEVENVVRIPMIKASWTLIPIDAHTTQATFQILLDLGGNVPAWVVNLFVENGPFETLGNFREEVEKKKYQHINLPYIKQQ